MTNSKYDYSFNQYKKKIFCIHNGQAYFYVYIAPTFPVAPSAALLEGLRLCFDITAGKRWGGTSVTAIRIMLSYHYMPLKSNPLPLCIKAAGCLQADRFRGNTAILCLLKATHPNQNPWRKYTFDTSFYEFHDMNLETSIKTTAIEDWGKRHLFKCGQISFFFFFFLEN